MLIFKGVPLEPRKARVAPATGTRKPHITRYLSPNSRSIETTGSHQRAAIKRNVDHVNFDAERAGEARISS